MNSYFQRLKVYHSKPFSIGIHQRTWGKQPYIMSGDKVLSQASLNGNSKQRRQQKRKLLRYLNAP